MRALFVAATVCQGLALLHGSLGVLAWLAVAALAAGLACSRARPRAETLAGLFGFFTVSLVIGCPWLFEMFATFDPHTPLQNLGRTIGFYVMSAAPLIACVSLGHVALRRWPLALPLWLPLAWGGGEQLRLMWTDVNITDWLATQWTTPPVLRALGHLGWWPTLGLCLFAAAGLGVGWALRSRATTLAAALVVLGLCCLPPLERGDLELLRGVAAVHTRSTLELPHAPTGQPLELVIWPEVAFDMRPALGEGPGRGAGVQPLLPDSEADHVFGLVTVLPGVGEQNQLLHSDAEGQVIASRAKRVLFPTTERRFLGLGDDVFVPGRATPRLDAGGRSLIAMICGEYLTRELIAEGKAAGGELLTISARDYMFPSEIATRQLLAVQVLRAVEYGVPAVRSSLGGRASFVAANGEVLAISDRDQNGMLTWSPEAGADDHHFFGDRDADEIAPTVAVLSSTATPHMRPRCPAGRCDYYEIEQFRCGDQRAETVIVAGHGAPERYLGQDVAEVAAAIRCLQPSLVVLDTCFGAAEPLLDALADEAMWFVGSPGRLPTDGLRYQAELFEPGPAAARALAVTAQRGAPLVRVELGRPDTRARIAALELGAPTLDPADRRRHALALRR